MIRAVLAAETTATTSAWSVHAEALRVRAGQRMAIDGLELRLGPGVHGLLGPNGAGKTTLIRALATVVRPASGRLQLLGQPLHGRGDLRGVRRRLGYLPQHFGFYPRFTLREFVEYLAWLREMPKVEVAAAVQRAVERVGLADRAGARLKTLSGGMLRRAGIAQAIVNDPQVLLLDEPTVGLDPEQRVAFRDLLRELGCDGCVLVSTHLVEDVVAACSNIMIIEDGRLVWQGTPRQLADLGDASGAGDSPAERGYTSVLSRYRQDREAGVA